MIVTKGGAGGTGTKSSPTIISATLTYVVRVAIGILVLVTVTKEVIVQSDPPNVPDCGSVDLPDDGAPEDEGLSDDAVLAIGFDWDIAPDNTVELILAIEDADIATDLDLDEHTDALELTIDEEPLEKACLLEGPLLDADLLADPMLEVG